jgi:hypothetical protein
MTLDELLNLVSMSTRDDWNIVTCWGSGSGPSYRSRPSYEVEEMSDEVMRSDEHGMVAAYRHDLAVTLAWGITSRLKFKERWANQFDDPDATSNFADLFYNGALVHREIFVVVDGGRAYLPLPSKAGGTEVDRRRRDFVRLLDNLEGRVSEFDRYFREAGFTVLS